MPILISTLDSASEAGWLRRRLLGPAVAILVMALAACGGSDNATAGASSSADDDAVPTIVATTSILGDVLTEVSGGAFEVVTIMPAGVDPHDFQPSAQEVAALGEADAIIANGGGFEEGLLDVLASLEEDGVPVYEALSAVSTLDGDHDHDHGHDDDEDHVDEEHDHDDEDHADEEHDHDDEDHADEEHDHDDEDHADEEHDHDDEDHADEDHADEEHDHDDEGVDPHFFTDPVRMADAIDGVVEFLVAEVDGLDTDLVRASAVGYIDELNTLHDEIEGVLDVIADGDRVLITNHHVFGYFADRYDFEVVGTIIPAATTADSADAQQIADLAEIVEAEGVRAIFADTSSSSDLVETLADEVGDIEVVELFSESLGGANTAGSTYVQMMRTNAERIADALG